MERGEASGSSSFKICVCSIFKAAAKIARHLETTDPKNRNRLYFKRNLRIASAKKEGQPRRAGEEEKSQPLEFYGSLKQKLEVIGGGGGGSYD